MPTIQIIVLGAIPPLYKPRDTDRELHLEHWLVLAYPEPARRVRTGFERFL